MNNHTLPEKIDFNLTAKQLETYEKYSHLALPRHTSYPIAALWHDDFGETELNKHLVNLGKKQDPISLYIHVPYCQQLCYYCACNKEIIGSQRLAKEDPRNGYLDLLDKEISYYSQQLRNNPVKEIHLGGGTPTFLTNEQLQRLVDMLQSYFDTTKLNSFSVEVDPRVTTADHIKILKKAGLNRISLGVQDFDEKVQRAINRIQPYKMIKDLVDLCHDEGITSINFDLIYGLPFQTLKTMEKTITQVLTLSPDRIAFYRLAVIPEMFKWQKAFSDVDLLKDAKLLEINQIAIRRFQNAGYHFIGLDHFSKETELLAQSYMDGTLRRNFQGMTTGGEVPVIGMGPSSISSFHLAYSQNIKKTKDWSKEVPSGFPVARGIELKKEDKIYQRVISELYCYGKIDKALIAKTFDLQFNTFFADELTRLKDLEKDGIVNLLDDKILLDPILGRLLVRTVASVFDKYIPKDAYKKGISSNQASRVG